MTRPPRLIGWAHTVFGKTSHPDVESLMADVSLRALDDAGVGPTDVDAIYVGVFNGGFSPQLFEGALVGQGHGDLAPIPATRVENACATGSAALHSALDFIESGRGRVALVVGAEKMTGVPGARVGEVLFGASHLATEHDLETFPGVFASLTERYADRYGDPHPAMALIAAKNHKNGVDNPYAQLRRDLGVEFCGTESARNPRVAGRLLRTDCSLVSDGAAAVVVATEDVSRSTSRSVVVRSRVHANDHLQIARRDDPLELAGAARSFRGALAAAGVGLDDLDLLETHDCFTIAELLQYEAFGIAEPGKAAEVLAEGRTARDGELPVNVSGGLKSKGHPIGATGVSQHVMAAMQLTGEAGDMQLDRVERAAVFNMGGAAVANYTTILEQPR